MESEYYPCLALYTKSPFINTPQPVFFQVYSPKLTKRAMLSVTLNNKWIMLVILKSFVFSISSDIDVIEWHEFLTPQLKLSQLFRAKPQGDVSSKNILLILKESKILFTLMVICCKEFQF